MALGSSQPLTEISTRDFPWGVKGAGASFLKSWDPQHLGALGTSLGLYEDRFTCVIL